MDEEVDENVEMDIELDETIPRTPPRPTKPRPSEPSTDPTAKSFQCTRCKKTISLSKFAQRLIGEDLLEAITKLRNEHADFHVAQDLSREVIDVTSSPEAIPKDKRMKPAKGKAATKSKPPAASGSIASFFQTGPSRKK